MGAEVQQRQRIFRQAADWMLKQQSAPLSAAEQQAFEQWVQQSEQHQRAWECVEHLNIALQGLPGKQARQILKQARQTRLRQLGGKLAVVCAVALSAYAGWMGWDSQLRYQLMAEYSTATGEQKRVRISDGSQVYLNTRTAFDTQFDQQQRLIKLHYGEIHISTAPDSYPVKRPFRVQTRQGVLEALGTVFNVRQLDDQTCVAVIKSAVEVRVTGGAPLLVRENQQLCFNRQGYQPLQMMDVNAVEAWQRKLLFTYDMPLEKFIQEIRRYHQLTYFQVDDEVKNMLISGSYPLDDLSQVLALLNRTYPVRVEKKLAGRVIFLRAKAE
ncbi:FecR domain-containing protein [Acinetobacter sp. WZC-1]|uniref:FecR domain-containing protein n=1 Tax=Acinetobacter sp. WZC-1 TaxID=3459034 RepID=UPI00403D6441